MDEATTDPLEARLAALEQRIAQLESHAGQPLPSARRPAPPRATAAPRPSSQVSQQWFDTGEGWLGRAGVALVVIGFVFLYRYAVDQGWLTPAMRVALGVLTGAAMLGSGLVFFKDRRRYRQILMGGGVVLLFIAGLAASELYNLVPGVAALVWHTFVAGIAFHIAARQDDPIMASIGAAGALLPTALLLADSVPSVALWVYLLIVMRWCALLTLRRSWRSLLVVSSVAAVIATFHPVPPEPVAQFGAALVFITAWLAFAALPLARDVIGFGAPQPQPLLSMELRFLLPSLVTLGLAAAADVNAPMLSFEVVTAAAAIGFATLALSLYKHRAPQPEHPAGSKRDALRGLQSGDVFSAALFACVIAAAAATLSGLEVPGRYVLLAVITAASVWTAFRLRAPALLPLAHTLGVLVVFEFLDVIDSLAAEGPFDPLALGLVVVTAIAVWTAMQFRRGKDRLFYLGAAYIIAHTILASELGNVEGAPWLASASYAVVGSAFVLVGLSRQSLLLQRAGLMSLALLVGRLFLFDLAHAGLGVRIVLFMVCGFAFLGLSFVFRERRRTVA